jgi:hypothetical protein
MVKRVRHKGGNDHANEYGVIAKYSTKLAISIFLVALAKVL